MKLSFTWPLYILFLSGLKDYSVDVYAHTGVLTDQSTGSRRYGNDTAQHVKVMVQ